MKIKLKNLSRSQYKGVATIAQNCCSVLRGDTFEVVQSRDVLMSLVLRMAAKVPTLRERSNSLTMSEAESMVLWRMVNARVMEFQPYEMGIGLWMLREIDLQLSRYVTLMRANLWEQQNYLRR